jgi:hypothetical protein
MPSENDLIERTYRAYFTVFQMGNPRAITPYYHIPSVFISATTTHVLANLQDAEQFFERMFYALRNRGYSRSVLTSVQVKDLADDLALVHSRGERFASDGNLLEQLAALYTMRKVEGTWRIATATMFDPERPLDLK